jgi:hypothetical protein
MHLNCAFFDQAAKMNSCANTQMTIRSSPKQVTLSILSSRKTSLVKSIYSLRTKVCCVSRPSSMRFSAEAGEVGRIVIFPTNTVVCVNQTLARRMNSPGPYEMPARRRASCPLAASDPSCEMPQLAIKRPTLQWLSIFIFFKIMY